MKRRSLRFRLLVLSAAAATLPALVISLFQQRISSDALARAIEQEQTQLARRLATDVDNEVRHAQSLVALVAHSSSFSAGSRIDQYEALHNLLTENPAFQETMYVNAVGDELVKVGRQDTRPHLFHRSENLKEPFISAPFFSGNRSPTIFLGEPVRSFYNPRHQGAVLAKMSFTTLSALMHQAAVGPRGEAFVVDEKGTLLAHPDERQVWAHTNWAGLPVVKEWTESPNTATPLREYSSLLGRPMMALAYPIPLLKSAVIVQQPKEDVYAPIDHMRNEGILWTLISLAVFIALAVAVAWKILKPLRLLKTAVEDVSAGKREVHLDIHTHDELEDLAKTFENMTASLGELERTRRDLIHMIVHDLKLPVSTILPSLESLLVGDFGKLLPDQVRFIQMARRSAQEMLMLIENLLDVAKMEEGKLMPRKDPFAPSDWSESVVANFKPLADAAHKKLTLHVARNVPAIEGDPALLARVLGNLISNALRHTPAASGEVAVSLYRDGNQLAVEVRDNGEGIPEEEQKHIFDKFIQGHHQKGNLLTGTGLGLTFCKMVVEAHGGHITLFSQPSEGSVFTFRLPAMNQPAGSPGKIAVPSTD